MQTTYLQDQHDYGKNDDNYDDQNGTAQTTYLIRIIMLMMVVAGWSMVNGHVDISFLAC